MPKARPPSQPTAVACALGAVANRAPAHRLWAAVAAVLFTAAMRLGCGSTPVPAHPGDPAPISSVDVIAAAWHTEVGVPTYGIHGPLATLLPDFPGAHELVFGWGQRTFYMARNPGVGDALVATFPSASVMLVIPVFASPNAAFPGSEIFHLDVSQPGLDRLEEYLWRYIKKGSDGRPIRIGPGPFPGSAFYASGVTYDLARTCNTFTVEGLRVAGLPISADGVILASQVVDRLRSLDRSGAQHR